MFKLTVISLVLVLSCCYFSEAEMVLKVLNQAAEEKGAVCLDGSPAAYYFEPSTQNSTTWVFFIEGGGWCYEENDCASRSKTVLGSSTQFSSTVGGFSFVSTNSTENPTFADANHVYLPYCDGASFSGNVDTPVQVGSTTLYFRGKRILDAVIADVYENGFDQATDVLLTGCSAGGLAVYLHADYFHSQLPSTVKRYGAVPISGFFLDQDTLAGEAVYPLQMQYVYTMQNVSGGVNQKCVSLKSEADKWQCMFAPYTYPFIESPIFVFNSVYDLWQFGCIFGSIAVPQNYTGNGECNAIAEWKTCTSNILDCDAAQIETVNLVSRATMLNYLESSQNFHKASNGAFLHGCFDHCAAQISLTSIQVNATTVAGAVDLWWNDLSSTSSLSSPNTHNYYPCEISPNSVSNCNPTCPTV